MIIEHKPPPDSINRFGDVAIVAQVHFFVLQGSPESFDEDVVVGPAPAVHGDPDFSGQKNRGEFLAGVLSSLVAVENFRFTPGEGALQSRDAESRVKGVGYLPGENITAVPVHYCCEIEKTLPEADIGYVAAPYLVGLLNGNSSQEIGPDPLVIPRDAQFWLGVQGFNPHKLHEPSHPLRVDLVFRSREHDCELSSPEKRAGRVELIDPFHQVKVQGGFSGLFVVVGGTGEAEKSALFFYGEIR